MAYDMSIIRAGYTRAFATIQNWYTDANPLLFEDIASMRQLLPELELAATQCIEQANVDQLKQIIGLSLQNLHILPRDIVKQYATLRSTATGMIDSTATEYTESDLVEMREVIKQLREVTQRKVITLDLASSHDGLSMFDDLLRCYKYLKGFPDDMKFAHQQLLNRAKSLSDSMNLKIGLISLIKEYYVIDITHIENMNNFTILLKAIIDSEDIELSAFERSSLVTYIQGIDNLLSTYQELNLAEAFQDTTHPEELMGPLNTKISSEKFSQYAGIISELVLLETDLKNIARINGDEIGRIAASVYRQMTQAPSEPTRLTMERRFRNLDYTQTLTAYFGNSKNLLDQIIKKLGDQRVLERKSPVFLHALTHARSSQSVLGQKGLDVNSLKAAIEDASLRAREAPLKPTMLAKAVLDVSLSRKFSLDEQSKPLSELDFRAGFNEYLRTTLSRVYPRDFSLHGQVLRFNLNRAFARSLGNLLPQFLSALDIKDTNNVSFDPRNFDALALNQLFEQDHNPLWLALKSTIPISDKLTAGDKINTYIALAGQFFERRIVEKGKYKGALEMAKAAYAVAAAYPSMPELKKRVEAAFQPGGTPVSMNVARTEAQNGHYGDWIVAKHIRTPADEQASVRKTLLGEDLPGPVSAESISQSSRQSSSESLFQAFSPSPSGVKSPTAAMRYQRPTLTSINEEDISAATGDDINADIEFNEPEYAGETFVASSEESALSEPTSDMSINYGGQTYLVILENINVATFPYVFAGTSSTLFPPKELQEHKIEQICQGVLTDLNQTYPTDEVISLCFKPNAEIPNEVNLEVYLLSSIGVETTVVYPMDSVRGPDGRGPWLKLRSYSV